MLLTEMNVKCHILNSSGDVAIDFHLDSAGDNELGEFSDKACVGDGRIESNRTCGLAVERGCEESEENMTSWNCATESPSPKFRTKDMELSNVSASTIFRISNWNNINNLTSKSFPTSIVPVGSSIKDVLDDTFRNVPTYLHDDVGSTGSYKKIMFVVF